jgi:hypothetical protein
MLNFRFGMFVWYAPLLGACRNSFLIFCERSFQIWTRQILGPDSIFLKCCSVNKKQVFQCFFSSVQIPQYLETGTGMKGMRGRSCENPTVFTGA